jgi:hypothetical protein
LFGCSRERGIIVADVVGGVTSFVLWLSNSCVIGSSCFCGSFDCRCVFGVVNLRCGAASG